MKLKELKSTLVHLKTQAEWDEYMGMCAEVGWEPFNENCEFVSSIQCLTINDNYLEEHAGFWHADGDVTILTLQELKDRLDEDEIFTAETNKIAISEEGTDTNVATPKPKMKYKVGDVLERKSGTGLTLAIKIQKIVQGYLDEDGDLWSDEELMISSYKLKQPTQVTLQEVRNKFGEDVELSVGFLRQWINEDLLKDDHDQITNEDIMKFLNIPTKD